MRRIAARMPGTSGRPPTIGDSPARAVRSSSRAMAGTMIAPTSARAPAAAPDGGRDRLGEVGPEVVDVLEADGQPQQALRHAALGLDARAALDQRLDAAEAGRVAHQPHGLLAAPGGRAVGELERQHAAAAGGHLAPGELVLGMARQARVVHGLDVGVRREAPRQLGRPSRPGAAARTCSVRRPRSSSQAGSGASTPPIVRRTHTRRSRSAESRVVTTPASRSECPPRYFVALCQARSAPRSSGRCRSGVANVLSQHSSAPPGVRRGGRRDVGDRERRVGRRLDDRERRAVAGAPEAVGVAQVVAAHLDAEAREHLGAEQLDLVVAARRDHESPCPARAPSGRCTSRPSCRSRRPSPRHPRARRAAPRPRRRRARARGRRATTRPERARTSSSGRARGRARATGCRRGRGRAASRAPCPKHSTPRGRARAAPTCGAGPRACARRLAVAPAAGDRDRLRRDRPRGRRRPRARRRAAAGPRARGPPARCARGARSASRSRRGWSRSARAARRPRSARGSGRRRARTPARPPQPAGICRCASSWSGCPGAPGSAPARRRGARRGGGRARSRSRPGAAGARAGCAGRAGAARRDRARARRRSCGGRSRAARAGRGRAS